MACMNKYTDEELLEELKRVSEEYCDGEAPTVNDMKEHGKISYATFSYRFDSWNKALGEIELEPNSCGRGNKVSKQEIKNDINKVARELNCRPSSQQYSDMGEHSIVTARQRFGSWWEALSAAGFSEFDGRDSSEEHNTIDNKNLIQEINRIGSKIGSIPTKKDIEKYSEYSDNAYEYNFGSWSEALRQSKFSLEENRKGVQVSDEKALEELKKAIEKVGIENSNSRILEESKYSETVYALKFGTVGKAIIKLGYEPRIRRNSPGRENIINDIKGLYRYYCEKGETPSQTQYMKKGKYSRNWVTKVFGSWNNAVKSAGFEPNEKIQENWKAPSGEDHHLWKENSSSAKYYGSSWYRQKKKVRERDGNECRLCGENTKSEYNLRPDIHHITHSKYWDVEEEHEKMNHSSNLISLCKKCHKRTEGKFKGRSHREFERLARRYLNIEEESEIKDSLFDY